MRYYHTFSFNDIELAEFGAVITQPPKHVIAIPDIELIETPYHSGDIILSNERYKNISFKIPIRAVPMFCNLTVSDFAYKLSEWLDTKDYGIYRDTYNASYFRYGIVTRIDDITAVEENVYETAITINFKPFLYSDAGTNTIAYSSANNAITATLLNPERWDSEPVIKIIGSGDFSVIVGDVTLALTGVNNYIVIDKEQEDVYDSGGSCNEKISALSLPYLKAGENIISIVGNSSFTVEITPNWRRL